MSHVERKNHLARNHTHPETNRRRALRAPPTAHETGACQHLSKARGSPAPKINGAHEIGTRHAPEQRHPTPRSPCAPKILAHRPKRVAHHQILDHQHPYSPRGGEAHLRDSPNRQNLTPDAGQNLSNAAALPHLKSTVRTRSALATNPEQRHTTPRSPPKSSCSPPNTRLPASLLAARR